MQYHNKASGEKGAEPEAGQQIPKAGAKTDR